MYQAVEHNNEDMLVFFVRVVVSETDMFPNDIKETCIGELSDLLLTHETNETYIVMASYEGLGAVPLWCSPVMDSTGSSCIKLRLL